MFNLARKPKPPKAPSLTAVSLSFYDTLTALEAHLSDALGAGDLNAARPHLQHATAMTRRERGQLEQVIGPTLRHRGRLTVVKGGRQ